VDHILPSPARQARPAWAMHEKLRNGFRTFSLRSLAMKFRFLLSTIGLLLLASCASRYQAETIKSKMERYQDEERWVNKPPAIDVPELTKNKTTSQKNKTDKELKKFSNKNIYFLALLGQYKKFNAFLNNSETTIQSCPQFHSVLTKEDLYSSQERGVALETIALNAEDKDWQRNPIYFLPLHEGTSVRLGDVLNENTPEKNQQFLKTALQTHTKRTFHELRQLCENGTSDNFYVMTNFFTHVEKQSKSFTQTNDGLKALIKTSLFSNHALLTSLYSKKKSSGRFPASTPSVEQTSYETEAMGRLQAFEAFGYIETLK
jgi:hypothetical protein